MGGEVRLTRYDSECSDALSVDSDDGGDGSPTVMFLVLDCVSDSHDCSSFPIIPHIVRYNGQDSTLRLKSNRRRRSRRCVAPGLHPIPC